MENLEGKVMTPELTDRTHSLKRPFRCLDFMIYRYFREPNDLGVWKMRNMMTVTIKMTERLHSFLCWLARLRADSDLKHWIRNVILAQAHYFQFIIHIFQFKELLRLTMTKGTLISVFCGLC